MGEAGPSGALLPPHEVSKSLRLTDCSQVCEEIKAHLDATWDPHWVVCIGRNFGSYVTHVTRNFVFFYYNEKAVMIYKAG